MVRKYARLPWLSMLNSFTVCVTSLRPETWKQQVPSREATDAETGSQVRMKTCVGYGPN